MSDAASDFEAIFAEFRPKVLRYLSGMVGPDEAEDISQNVFLKVHAGLEEFRGESSLATWIYRIATNAALDRLRSRSFHQTAQIGSHSELSDDTAIETAETDLAGNTVERSAECSLIRREMNECIKSYVDALAESYRSVLVLSDLEGLKNQEIAEILGLSVDTVKIRLHRARRALKNRFEGGCEFYRTEGNDIACDHKAPAIPSSS